MNQEYVKVAKMQEIPKNESISVRANDQFIALVNNNGQFFAIADMCPHAGAPLGGGWVEDDCIVCPHHYWKFNIKTGECPHIKDEKIGTYQVKVENEEIFVLLPKK